MKRRSYSETIHYILGVSGCLTAIALLKSITQSKPLAVIVVVSTALILTVAALLIPTGEPNASEVDSQSIYSAEQTSQTIARVDGKSLYLLGTFDEYTSDKVIAILKSYPNVERIVLTANGGSINDQDTIKLGHYIRRQGLDTHLIANGVAASGGVSLYLAGVNRSVGEGAHIGVHAWAQCSGDGESLECKQANSFPKDDDAHDLHRDYIHQMLGSDHFYWFSIASAPHNSIYWLSERDLERFKITNQHLSTNLRIPFPAQFKDEYESTCHNCP